MNEQPFALHITWTCYGTWLPGDPRGYVSHTYSDGAIYKPKANIPGTAYTRDDRRTYKMARACQKGETVRLNSAQARVVCECLEKAARERDWRIMRAAIMANHAHVVIMDCPDNGPPVRRILKGVSQADLCKHFGRNQRWWTGGGSDRYKKGDEAVMAAIGYVADQKGILVEIVDMDVRSKLA
jgi:REP element-mobilizing transposase RayT